MWRAMPTFSESCSLYADMIPTMMRKYGKKCRLFPTMVTYYMNVEIMFLNEPAYCIKGAG